MSYIFLMCTVPDHSKFVDYKIQLVIYDVQPLKCFTECIKVDHSSPVIGTWKDYESFMYFNENSVSRLCVSAYMQKFSNQLLLFSVGLL
jgi:hypothetical protein